MILVFHPSFEQRDITGINRVTRADGKVYTLHNVDGTTQAKALRDADENNVLAIIAAIRGESTPPEIITPDTTPVHLNSLSLI